MPDAMDFVGIDRDDIVGSCLHDTRLSIRFLRTSKDDADPESVMDWRRLG